MRRHPEIKLNRVFIDFHVESKKIEEFINTQPEKDRPLKMKDEDIYISDDAYERVFQLHSELHKARRIDWSFTRFANITDLLEKNNYHYQYFDISNETVHHTLMTLINEVNLHVLQDNQIVCGYLTIRNVHDEVKK